MAGSYGHCVNEDGSFRAEDGPLLDDLGDAWEAAEHMVWMIAYLSDGDRAKIAEAEDAYYAWGRNEGPDHPPLHGKGTP